MRAFRDDLELLHRQALHRRLKTISPSKGTIAHIGGRDVVNFSSNDYLGLAQSPALAAAFSQAVADYGVGSGASRLICGSSPAHEALETALANFKETEAALSFATGYSTALGAVTALIGQNDIAILDKLAHASLIDGVRLSGATARVFPHNRMDKLESHLRWAREKLADDGRILVITESVFSMDGDTSPLNEIIALKDQFGALLMVDEAHAVGVLGDRGRGLAPASDVDVQMGTLGKALGVAGGYVCGSSELIDLLVNQARSFIYSTAPLPAQAVAAATAVGIVSSDEGDVLRTRLWENIDRLHSALGNQCKTGSTAPACAIIPVIVGDETAAMETSAALLNAGFLVPAIRYPTVKRGTARLRITLSAAHTPDQIDSLAATLSEM